MEVVWVLKNQLELVWMAELNSKAWTGSNAEKLIEEDFLNKHGFVECLFDGCMYGVVAKYGAKKGMPIRKPWHIMCKNSCLPTMLNKLCDGSHEHCPCQGGETRLTQAYSPAIAKVVHRALRQDSITKAGGSAATKALPVIVHVHGILRTSAPVSSAVPVALASARAMGPPAGPLRSPRRRSCRCPGRWPGVTT